MLCPGSGFWKNTIILFFLLTSTIYGFSQDGMIKGSVSDAESKESLAGANIIAASNKSWQGTASRNDGGFEFRDLSAGTYVLTVSYIGYIKQKVEINLQDGEAKELEIKLTPSKLTLNPIIISASRHQEKILAAPAAVTVIEPRELAGRTTLSVFELLQGVPGADIVSTGLNSNRAVIRGYGDSFSGRLLTLTDHRIANVPSLRVNLSQLIPVTRADIDRIEVLEGPGSALYGPNAAGGVMHIITKSPFDSRGTSASFAIGERDLVLNSFRHAGVLSKNVAFKISGEYYQGRDWEFFDPTETDTSATRDFDIRKISGDARIDFRLNNGFNAILSGGLSRISNIEITGSSAGAFQLKDWTTSFLQARLNHNNFFAQAFYNQNDAGKTFSLRNGNPIVDNSSLFVAQIQHHIDILKNTVGFTYGADLLLTRPNSESTIYGRNEDSDDINELGFYLQAQATLSDKIKLVAAARIDEQNHLPKPMFSPRAAIVFKPDNKHNFRLTFNQAYESPATQDLFLDLQVASNLGGLPYAIWFRGVPPATGYHFRQDENGGIGGLYMQSPFNPAGREIYLPADATQTWPAVVALLQTEGIDISAIPAPTSDQVSTTLASFNSSTLSFNPTQASQVKDVPPLEARRTTTLELGYKGVVDDNLLLFGNFYRETNSNFIRSFGTPNAFFEETSLFNYLENYLPSEMAEQLAANISEIPVGTITPEEGDPADILLAVRNFGEVSHYGLELGFYAYPTHLWTVSGNYAFISKNTFREREGNIILGAPKHKFNVKIQYQNNQSGLTTGLQGRFVDGFPVTLGVIDEVVDSYFVIDFSSSLTLPFHKNLSFNLSIQNFLNKKHREYINVPRIGRLAILRLAYKL